jgi:SPW repeat
MVTLNRQAATHWSHSWPDWVNLLLGLWMLAAPFLLGSGEYFAAAGTSFMFGIVIAVFAASSLLRPEAWQEGMNIVIGLCLALSPWLFSYTADRTLTMNALIVGLIVTALAIWSIMASMPGDHWWHHTHHGSR